jgi:micrococcal nuclease
MYTYLATLVRIVDGDTVDLMIDQGFGNYHKERFRVIGVDAPEEGKPGYRDAISFVEDWFLIHEPLLTVRTVKDKKEKYGRYLAEISAHRRNAREVATADVLSQDLLASGHAEPYVGGKRG